MPSIIPTTANMQKSQSASGATTMNCGDAVATILGGRTIDAVRHLAEKYNIDCSKYDTLNPGHQRMVIGNRLRKVLRINAKEISAGMPGISDDAAYDQAVADMTAEAEDSSEKTYMPVAEAA